MTDMPTNLDPVATARAHAIARLVDVTRAKSKSDADLGAAISAAADLGISVRDIAAAVTAAGVPISHDTVARRIRDIREADPGRLYHVDGYAISARAIPSDAPTLRHGDRIAITDWVCVPVDLTAYDPSEEDPAERTGYRTQHVTLEYAVSTNGGTNGKRPFVTRTYEAPTPGLVEIKHGGFAWVGNDLYQLVTDLSTEAARPKLSLVMPRPSKPDARTAPARPDAATGGTSTDTEEPQP